MQEYFIFFDKSSFSPPFHPPHYTTLHNTTPYYTTLHNTTQPNTTQHYPTLPFLYQLLVIS